MVRIILLETHENNVLTHCVNIPKFYKFRMLVLTLKQYEEIYDLVPDIDLMWSKMLIYELINEGKIEVAKMFFMNYYKHVIDLHEFHPTLDYFDRLFSIPDCQGILIKMFSLCFQDFLVFLEKNLLSYLFKDGCKKINIKKSNRIVINSLIFNNKSKFSFLSTELIIQQITLEIQSIVRKNELINGLGLNQSFYIENSLLKPSIYNNIDTLGITNMFLQQIKNNLNFEAGNTYDILANIDSFKHTFFDYNNLDKKYSELSSDWTKKIENSSKELREDIEMTSQYSNNFISDIWNENMSNNYDNERKSNNNDAFDADDFFNKNRFFDSKSVNSEQSNSIFFSKGNNNSVFNGSENKNSIINPTKIIISDSNTTIHSSKNSLNTNTSNYNNKDLKTVSVLDSSIKHNISVKRNFNSNYFINNQYDNENTYKECLNINEIYKKNLTNFQILNCKVHIEEEEIKHKSDFEIYSVKSKKTQSSDLETKLNILKAINNFLPKYFKKENLNKKIIRLFYKYVKYLKSFISNKNDNYNFSEMFINKKLLPPFSTTINNSENVSFKSYNYKYIEWLFNDKLMFDLYEEFASNFSVYICDKMTYEYDLSFKEPFSIKKLSQYIRYLHYVSEKNLKPQEEENYSRISKRISMISGSFYPQILNSLNSKYKGSRLNINNKSEEENSSSNKNEIKTEKDNDKKFIFKIEKVKRYVTSI